MKFLVVVTPPSIYCGCSTQKTFWEEKFTGKKYLFQSVNMKNCGRRKVRKHKEIKGSDKIVTLNVSEKFDSLNNMKTTSSESKGKLGRSGKGLVTALDFRWHTFPFCILRPYFSLEIQCVCQPFS